MRFCTLVSGSSGNAVYLSEGGCHLLIDAGLSYRELTRQLGELGMPPSDLLGAAADPRAHSDHVKGLAQFAMRTGVPIYGSRETLMAVCTKLGSVMPTGLRPFRAGGHLKLVHFR